MLLPQVSVSAASVARAVRCLIWLAWSLPCLLPPKNDVAPSWRWQPRDPWTFVPRGSAALPPAPSLSLPQTCALLGWNKSDLLAVESAWQGMPADPSPLLLAANLALLPTDFCRAFDIAAEGEDCASAASAQKLQVLVVAALRTARLWWEHQEAECLTDSRLAPLGAASLR